jgi:Na+-translocating ferredoxin:NAD+ oxidoreductase RnfG subunit
MRYLFTKLILLITSMVILLAIIGHGCSVQENKSMIWREKFPTADKIREVPPENHPIENARLYELANSSGIIGFFVEKEVKGRSGPFKIVVLIDSEFHVKYAAVSSYPYDRGEKVRSSRFTQQFNGKGIDDPIRLGEDITAITGATISCRAMTEGIRNIIELMRGKYHLLNP